MSAPAEPVQQDGDLSVRDVIQPGSASWLQQESA